MREKMAASKSLSEAPLFLQLIFLASFLKENHISHWWLSCCAIGGLGVVPLVQKSIFEVFLLIQ